MNRGLLQQVATPNDLYEFPNSRFVADFIGRVNLFSGRLRVHEPGHAVIRSPELPCPVYVDHRVAGARDADLWVALRPEKIDLRKRLLEEGAPRLEDAPPLHNVAAGLIRHVSYLGGSSLYAVELEGGCTVTALRPNLSRRDEVEFALNEPVWLTWRACAPAVLLS
jgi:spermidine/putrescine transport system ATP-binding protein